jgi:hypothetical protein
MKKYFHQIKYLRLTLLIATLLLIVAFSFAVIFSNDEGYEVNSSLLAICNFIYLIIAYPFFYVFSQVYFFSEGWDLVMGIFTGCIFYGLLTEVALIAYRSHKNKNAIQTFN